MVSNPIRIGSIWIQLIVNDDYQVVIRAYVYVLEIAAIYDIPFLMAKSRFLFYHPVEGVCFVKLKYRLIAMITLTVKFLLYVLSFIDDNFMPIMSFIKDKIGIYCNSFCFSMKRM